MTTTTSEQHNPAIQPDDLNSAFLYHMLQLSPFSIRFAQVLMQYERELDRKQSGSQGSAHYLYRLRVHQAMTLLLTKHHLEHVRRERAQRKSWTEKDKLTTKLLNTIMATFGGSINDLEQRFPDASMPKWTLAQSFGFEFTDITSDEAEQDAAEVKAYMAEQAT